MSRDRKDAYRAELEAQKRGSTAQLLMKCARLVNERALARVKPPPGAPAPRAAHTALFPHVPLEGGARISELATKVGISKQAVGQLVDDLEAAGVVERTPDPDDARAKRVRWTPKGKKALLSGLATLREVEDELRRAIGDRRWSALHDALGALHDHLIDEGRDGGA